MLHRLRDLLSRTRIAAAAQVVASLALAACADGPPAGHTFETLPNGAVLVVNAGDGAWTEATAWRAVEALRIGVADGNGPDVLGAPIALEVDGDGNVYVLDRMAGEIRVFSPDGRHLRTLGRKGAGPGELADAAGLSIDPDGGLWVYDPGNTRFSVFAPDGTLRSTHPRTARMAAYPWPGRVDRTGRLWDLGGGIAGLGGTPALIWSRPGTGEQGSADLPVYEGEFFRIGDEGRGVSANVPFSPTLVWTLDADGRLWSGISDAYRIHHHEPGGDTLRIVELAHTPVAVTPEERRKAIENLSWFTQQGGKVDASRIPSTKPPFAEIRTDDRGYLWVTPAGPAGADSAAFDVFDPEGVYQGRLAVPAAPDGLHIVIVRGDRLYAVVLAEEGHPQVVVFRLEGRPEA